jgi:hypothetical protein
LITDETIGRVKVSLDWYSEVLTLRARITDLEAQSEITYAMEQSSRIQEQYKRIKELTRQRENLFKANMLYQGRIKELEIRTGRLEWQLLNRVGIIKEYEDILGAHLLLPHDQFVKWLAKKALGEQE